MFNARPPFRYIDFGLATLSFQNILKYVKDNMICSVPDAVYVLSAWVINAATAEEQVSYNLPAIVVVSMDKF